MPIAKLKGILNSRIPVSITLIASGVFGIGFEAIISMIGDILLSKITINLSGLLVLVGVGLFTLDDFSRKCTIVITWLAALVLVGFVVFEIVRPGSIPTAVNGVLVQGWRRYVVLIPIFGFISVILIWVNRTLRSPEIVSEFRRSRS